MPADIAVEDVKAISPDRLYAKGMLSKKERLSVGRELCAVFGEVFRLKPDAVGLLAEVVAVRSVVGRGGFEEAATALCGTASLLLARPLTRCEREAVCTGVREANARACRAGAPANAGTLKDFVQVRRAWRACFTVGDT